MNTKDTLKIYEEVKEEFRFFTTSGVRIKIILSLNEAPKNLNDLRDDLDLESSPVLRAVRMLQKQNIIFKKNDRYFLSFSGKILALKSKSLFKTFLAVKKNEKLWLNHEISGIPDELLKKIECLSDSFLVESTLTDIIKPHTTYAKMLSTAPREIKGLSTMFYYPYIDLYRHVLQKNASVDLILTCPVLNKIVEIIGEKYFNDVLSLSKNLNLWQIDDKEKMAITVTEKFVAMGLFSDDGTYDPTINLISKNKEAIEWGNQLFEYYLKKAKKIKLNEIIDQ